MSDVVFVCDDASPLNSETSATALLMKGAMERGLNVVVAAPNDISRSLDGVTARVRAVTEGDGGLVIADMPRDLALNDAHSVHIRQDPPFDMAYITLTYMLDDVAVPVLNPPATIRNGAEKFLPLQWPELCPPTLMTQSAELVREFLAEHGEIILKPLYAFHSYGVMHVKEGDRNIGSYLEYFFYTHKEPIIAQAYVPAVQEGNKRLVFLAGDYVGGYVTKPEADGVRIYRDSVDEILILTEADEHVIAQLSPWLKEQKLFFVGVDVIGDKVIEINTTSTGSLHRMNALYGRRFDVDYWDKVDALR